MKAVIRLIAPDDYSYVVPEQIVYLFPTIGPMINKEREVWLEEVHGMVMPQVIQWAMHHLDKNNKSTADPQKFVLELDAWDSLFVKQQHPQHLIEIIFAGHYLGNKYLRDLAGMALVDVIRENTPEQNEEIFGSSAKADELLEKITIGVALQRQI